MANFLQLFNTYNSYSQFPAISKKIEEANLFFFISCVSELYTSEHTYHETNFYFIYIFLKLYILIKSYDRIFGINTTSLSSLQIIYNIDSV